MRTSRIALYITRCICTVTLLIGSVAPWRSASGQSTGFALSTGAVTIPTPGMSNYTAWPASATGPVTDSVAVPFTVSVLNQNSTRITTVLIRCVAVTGPKQCTDVEWRNGPVGPWRALTLLDNSVESRTVIPNGLNDPWSGTIWLRVRIAWADPAPSLVASNIALTLSVYRP